MGPGRGDDHLVFGNSFRVYAVEQMPWVHKLASSVFSPWSRLEILKTLLKNETQKYPRTAEGLGLESILDFAGANKNKTLGSNLPGPQTF